MKLINTCTLGQHLSNCGLKIDRKWCHLATHLQLGDGQADIMPHKPFPTAFFVLLYMLMQYNCQKHTVPC